MLSYCLLSLSICASNKCPLALSLSFSVERLPLSICTFAVMVNVSHTTLIATPIAIPTILSASTNITIASMNIIKPMILTAINPIVFPPKVNIYHTASACSLSLCNTLSLCFAASVTVSPEKSANSFFSFLMSMTANSLSVSSAQDSSSW